MLSIHKMIFTSEVQKHFGSGKDGKREAQGVTSPLLSIAEVPAILV